MTKREFAKKDETFQNRCKMANVRATGRQASKYLMSTGMAWNVRMHKAKPLLPGMGGYYKPVEVAE